MPITLPSARMDFSSLKEQVTNLSLYDIKAGVRKVQNGKSLLLDMVESIKKAC